MLVPIQIHIGHFVLVAFKAAFGWRWTDELKFVKFCFLIHFIGIQRRGHIKLRFSICAVNFFYGLQVSPLPRNLLETFSTKLSFEISMVHICVSCLWLILVVRFIKSFAKLKWITTTNYACRSWWCFGWSFGSCKHFWSYWAKILLV